MTKLDKEKVVELVKTGGNLIGSCSTYMLICGLSRAVLPPQVSLLVKGGVLVGDLLISNLVGSVVEKHIDSTIDETVDEINDRVKEVKRCVDILKDKTDETTKTETEVG